MISKNSVPDGVSLLHKNRVARGMLRSKDQATQRMFVSGVVVLVASFSLNRLGSSSSLENHVVERDFLDTHFLDTGGVSR